VASDAPNAGIRTPLPATPHGPRGRRQLERLFDSSKVLRRATGAPAMRETYASIATFMTKRPE
jgi:hypothetical protein